MKPPYLGLRLGGGLRASPRQPGFGEGDWCLLPFFSVFVGLEVWGEGGLGIGCWNGVKKRDENERNIMVRDRTFAYNETHTNRY